jgi:hypothetical protein
MSPHLRLRPSSAKTCPSSTARQQRIGDALLVRRALRAFVELCDLYDKHIHDQSERRFIVERDRVSVGLVELVEINHIHRRAEFQIIIAPAHQGNHYATIATRLAMDYAFTVLNLYKLSLIVDCENLRAIGGQLGFHEEGRCATSSSSANTRRLPDGHLPAGIPRLRQRP